MSLSFQPMMESRPIREIAYEVLKKAIITGEIPAGERIVETDYADRLHISRTPLREALRKLERDGLVEYVMRRGVIVHAFTADDVEQIYTIRNSLEMLTLPDIIANATAEDIAELREMLAKMDELDAHTLNESQKVMLYPKKRKAAVVVVMDKMIGRKTPVYDKEFEKPMLKDYIAVLVCHAQRFIGRHKKIWWALEIINKGK